MEKVIIVIGRTITTLSTLRALKPLRKRGYKIMLATDQKKENIALYSNIPDKKFCFSVDIISGLISIAHLFKNKPALLFTGDPEVVQANLHRKKLSIFYRFMLPETSVFNTLMEKGLFTKFALLKGLQIPKTVFAKKAEELKEVKQEIPYPFIVKPYLLHALKIENDQQLFELADQLTPTHYHSTIIQQYIAGEDDNLFFVFLLFDPNGKLVHHMTAKKLRQWPISYGTTSLAVTVENDKLWNEVQKFIAATHLVGFCSIEYKYDRTTDQYFIMEPTVGRFNQQIALTTACGVNFPLAMAQLLNGEKIAIKAQKNNVFWIYESNDLFSYFHSQTQYGYLKNFFKPGVKALFSFSDPWPMLFEIYSLGKKKIKKLIRNARFHWYYSSERPTDKGYI